jgi:hypothetical protein
MIGNIKLRDIIPSRDGETMVEGENIIVRNFYQYAGKRITVFTHMRDFAGFKQAVSMHIFDTRTVISTAYNSGGPVYYRSIEMRDSYLRNYSMYGDTVRTMLNFIAELRGFQITGNETIGELLR